MRFFFFFKTSTNSFSPGGNFGYPCRKTTANWCKSIKGRLDLDGLRSERKPIVKCQSLRATIIIRTTLATFVSSYIHSTVFVVSFWFSSKRIFTFFFFSSSYRFHTCLIVWVSLRERKWQRMWCGIINFVLWIYIFLIFGYTVNLTFLITINGYIFRTVILFFLFSFFLYFFFRLKILNYHFYYIIILFTIRYLNLPRLFNVSRCLSYSTFVSILRSFK